LEGVCSQTEFVIKQAWEEKLKCILVFNKIDRLISEVQLDATEAYYHLGKQLEKVNSILGNLIQRDLVKKNIDGEELDRLIEEKEKECYFDPVKGNVVFCSALDCWGFTLPTFAQILSKKLGFNKEAIVKYLWGEYYFNGKQKKVFTEPPSENSKPMFVEFILDNLYKLYKIVFVEKDVEKITKTAESFKANILKSELNMLEKDPRPLMRVNNFNIEFDKTMVTNSNNSIFSTDR
jgi:ribosome assembly protein 1